jgi:CHAT domain-containing protein
MLSNTPGITDDMPHDSFVLRLLSRQGGLQASERDFLASVLQPDVDPPAPQRAARPGAPANPPTPDSRPVVPAHASPMWTGVDALQRGDLQAAEALWTTGLQTARRNGQRLDEAVLVNDLGVLEAARGSNVAAQARFASAVQLFEARLRGDRETGASTEKRLKRQFSGALDGVTEAMQQAQAPVGLAIAQLNQANQLAHMGQRSAAELLFKQVVADTDGQRVRADGDEDAERAATLLLRRARADLARLYLATGRADDARALAPVQAQQRGRSRPGDSDQADSRGPAPTVFPIWLLGPASALATAVPGTASRDAARNAKTGCREETLADVARDQPLAYAEASQQWLDSEAQRLETNGDWRGAMDSQLRAALLAAIVGSPEREQAAWAALQRLALKQAEPAAAALYGKRAVNAAQLLRGQIEALPRQARQAFLAERRRTYVALAQTLLDRQRLAEAEAVLRLLKEDEGQILMVAAQRQPRGALPLAAVEATWSAAFDALAARGRALHAERQALLAGQTASIWTAPRTRAAQQELLDALTLVMAEPAAQGQGSQNSPGDTRSKQASTAIGKPQAQRGAADPLGLDLIKETMARTLNSAIQDAMDNTEQAPRSGRPTDKPPSDFQRQALNDFDQRLQLLSSALATRLIGMWAEPAAAAGSGQSATAALRAPRETRGEALFGSMAERLRANLSIARRLDAVDADALALRKRLQPALAAPAALQFDSTAQAALAVGQQTLAALPAGTVAVYYLQGETRLDALVVDARRREKLRIDVSAPELATRIKRYREAMEAGSLDLLPEARSLYDKLWRPLGLAAGADRRPTTVMLSLDGALRALPFAALHDGQRWLIEHHALAVYTSAAPAALTARPSQRWRIAAFGASAGGSIDGTAMSPLPAVPDELAAIVSAPADALSIQLAGGRSEAKLDAAFTAATLQQALAKRMPVLHLASHFQFTPGDAQRSALLLGDGSALRLSTLAGPAWRLDHVEQVTLSACRTALSGDDAFGQEVEGLATLLQAQGAAAVLATLWSVDDGSTAAFMAAMYGLRERDTLSRAEAMRQAQLKLLSGVLTPERPRIDGLRRSGERDDGKVSAWTHPQHWAPFVLMGNWL